MSRRVRGGPFALLGAMTALALGGPVGIGAVLKGGASPEWPPDRPVEWVVVLGVSGAVLALMLACLAVAWTNRPAAIGERPSPPGEDRA